MRNFLIGSMVAMFTLVSVNAAFAYRVPRRVSYQGQLVTGTPRKLYNGEAEFKFAIVRPGANEHNLWSNDATPVGEPGEYVVLSVRAGMFSVMLGDPGMEPLTHEALNEAGIFEAILRIWVNTGEDFEQLPDQDFASTAFALTAREAQFAVTAGSALEGDDDWTVDGDNIYRPEGLVGIGTSTPTHRLDVLGMIRVGKNPGAFSASIHLDNDSDERTVGILGNSNGGGRINLFSGTANDATIFLDAKTGGTSLINLRGGNGATTMKLMGDSGGGGRINLFDGSALLSTIFLDANNDGRSMISLRDVEGDTTVDVVTKQTGGGRINLFNGVSSPATMVLDANYNNGGTSRLITDVLQVNGADLSEHFSVEHGDRVVEPGMVVTINPAASGGLVVCDRPYDRGVAGIVSGAGGVRPGMLMGQKGTVADGEYPIALTGRVYCWVDASFGAISPGDLLTTSDTPGHAKRVTDHDRAHGATLGKAMTGLESGKGLVLVLVTLQ